MARFKRAYPRSIFIRDAVPFTPVSPMLIESAAPIIRRRDPRRAGRAWVGGNSGPYGGVAAPAGPIIHVKDAVEDSGAVNTVTVPVNTATGNTLIVYALAAQTGNNPLALASITDSTGTNVWHYSTQLNSQSPPAAGAYNGTSVYQLAAIGYCVNAAAVTSVTVTTTGVAANSSLFVTVSEFSGVLPQATIDGAASSNTVATAGSDTSPNIQVTGSSDVLAACNYNNGTLSQVSPGWTSADPAFTAAAWQITAAPATQNVTWTFTSPALYTASAILAIGVPVLVPRQLPPAAVSARHRQIPHRAVAGNKGTCGGGIAVPATATGIASLTGAGTLTAAGTVLGGAQTGGLVRRRRPARAVLGDRAAAGAGFAAAGIVYAAASLTGAGVVTASGTPYAAAARGGLIRRRTPARAVVGNNGSAGDGVAAPASTTGTASLTGAGVLTAAAVVLAAAVTTGRVYQRHVTAARLVFRGVAAPPLPVALPRPPPQRARLRLARAVTGPRPVCGSGFAAPGFSTGTASLTGAGALTASGTPLAPPATGGLVRRRTAGTYGRAATGSRVQPGGGYAAPGSAAGSASLTGAGTVTATGTVLAPAVTGGLLRRRAVASYGRAATGRGSRPGGGIAVPYTALGVAVLTGAGVLSAAAQVFTPPAAGGVVRRRTATRAVWRGGAAGGIVSATAALTGAGTVTAAGIVYATAAAGSRVMPPRRRTMRAVWHGGGGPFIFTGTATLTGVGSVSAASTTAASGTTGGRVYRRGRGTYGRAAAGNASRPAGGFAPPFIAFGTASLTGAGVLSATSTAVIPVVPTGGLVRRRTTARAVWAGAAAAPAPPVLLGLPPLRITLPAPHRVLWRGFAGPATTFVSSATMVGSSSLSASATVIIPVALPPGRAFRRTPGRGLWRGGLPQPVIPPLVPPSEGPRIPRRTAARAVWRGRAVPPTAAGTASLTGAGTVTAAGHVLAGAQTAGLVRRRTATRAVVGNAARTAAGLAAPGIVYGTATLTGAGTATAAGYQAAPPETGGMVRRRAPARAAAGARSQPGAGTAAPPLIVSVTSTGGRVYRRTRSTYGRAVAGSQARLGAGTAGSLIYQGTASITGAGMVMATSTVAVYGFPGGMVRRRVTARAVWRGSAPGVPIFAGTATLTGAGTVTAAPATAAVNVTTGGLVRRRGTARAVWRGGAGAMLLLQPIAAPLRITLPTPHRVLWRGLAVNRTFFAGAALTGSGAVTATGTVIVPVPSIVPGVTGTAAPQNLTGTATAQNITGTATKG